MNITLTGTKIAQDTKFLAFEKNNGVDVINITVDTDESWIYKLDVKYPNKCCSGEQLYNIIDLTRNGNVYTVVLTKDMLPFTGKYMMQLRAISGDKVYHSDTFDAWIKYSIEPASTYDPVPSEFYQIEQNVTEMNNHPPKPGQNGYWLVWDITTSQYKESDIPLPDGTLPEVTADTSGKYLSNDGKKAYWAEVQTGTEGKIDKIEVNSVEQPIIDKTVNIAVPTKTSDLSNDSGYITNEALNSYATKAELPTKVSQLENDSKFINESALDGYAKKTEIPTKTSELTNDNGYITNVALEPYAKTVDIPTKTSQLENDSHYITANEAPVTSVNSKTGVVQLNASDVGALPDTTVIPTKTSQLDNDSGFITSSQAPVQSVNNKTGAVSLTATDVSAIPSTLTGTAGQVLTKTADGQEWKDAAKDLPNVTTSDNGKFLRVVSGAWAAAEGDASFDITGASTGQSPIINAVDAAGKPTAWGTALLAKVDGSNIPGSMQDTFRTHIAALPGVKFYGKADANGKIMAYIDAACTQEVTYVEMMGLAEYGNALLIYDHKTYQCVGFEEPASMQGSGRYVAAVFFRSEIVTDSAGDAVLKVETAKLNIQDYMIGEIDAPITITAGELPLTTTTTT